ncbi:protein translocase SEC61 complex subunit gamma [Candidatus Woesearchaeota archaeon]|nr:protein translocase SEC61 complex subunit gamma [Candidatus Woesearchaeota archaeon]
MISKLKEQLAEYRRVYSITHKPDRLEFISIVKITGIGIGIIGILGFFIHIGWSLLT